jgi:hypothetical protein
LTIASIILFLALTIVFAHPYNSLTLIFSESAA